MERGTRRGADGVGAMTPLYMRPRAHAAEAIERAAKRAGASEWVVPLAEDNLRDLLRHMVEDGGTAPIDLPWVPLPYWCREDMLRACLHEGLVCCDHSSGVWRLTDLGRAGVGP